MKYWQGIFQGNNSGWFLAWAELHQKELIDDWHLLQSGETAKSIEPLK